MRTGRVLTADDPVVADHRVECVPVLPAAAQADAILRAASAGRPARRWWLDNLVLTAPLAVTGTGAAITVEIDATGTATLSARPVGRPEAPPVVHARAGVTSGSLPPPTYVDTAALEAAAGPEVPLAELDRWRDGSGITYGPRYRVIRSVRRDGDRILAVVRPATPEPGSVVDPAVLDAVLQCLGVLDGGVAGRCLPWFVGRIAVRRPVRGTVLAVVERTAGSGPGGCRGRASVYTEQGEVVLELDRIVLRGTGTRDAVTAARPVTSRPVPAGDATPPSGTRPGLITVPTWRAAPAPPAAPVRTLLVGTAPELAGTHDRLPPTAIGDGTLAARLVDDPPELVVYAPGSDGGDPSAVVQEAAALVRALAVPRPAPALTVLTRGAHAVRPAPAHTALWGLFRSVRAEQPRTPVTLVDLAPGTPAGSLAPPRDAGEHVLRDGVHLAPVRLPVDGPPAAPFDPRGGRFLITGGMAGIGLHVAEMLAGLGCAHLTLTGRTVPADGPRRERLDRLAARCDVRLLALDVTAATGAFDGERFDAVVHSAGVLRDGLARTLTPERIADVLAPKIAGVQALDALFDGDHRPGAVVLFSSVSAVDGNLGQSSYGAANAFLDGYAARRRADGERWWSLNWGLWNAGMGERVVAGAAARGIPALEPDAGLALLRDVLGRPPGQYVLSADARPKDDHMTGTLAPGTGVWPSLSTILTTTMHLPAIEPSDDLLELGLDSMMAVEIAAALSRAGYEVDPAVLFERTAVRDLAAHLESLPAAGGAAPPAAPAATAARGTTPSSTATAGTAPSPPGPAGERPATAAPATTTPATAAPTVTAPVTTAPGGPAQPGAGAYGTAPVPAAPALTAQPLAARAATTPAVPAPPRRPGDRFVPDWDRFRSEPDAANPPRTATRAVPPAPAANPTAAPAAPTPATVAPVTHGPLTRTLPGRLTDRPDGTFLDRRIDDLSREDREIVARGRYFYEPVVEEETGSWIRFDDRWYLNFASYSYLGLIGHDYVDARVQEAVRRHGTGAHGVRLLAGTLNLHRELERTIARFLGTEDAIVFSSGYMANVATVGALVGPGDTVIGDVYNHASILDGYRLSGARVITYAHNDLAHLERALQQAGDGGRLVVTDAVFSMDGDIAPLPGIVELCERYDAPLMVDEAHSLGVLGATGRGITEHFGLAPDRVPVKMGTLSKTVPSAGGYVAGSADLVFALKNNARGWMFSAAVTPANAAAALAAFEVMAAAPDMVTELRSRTERYRSALHRLGFDTLASESPVVPVLCRDTGQAQEMARLCQADGVFVQPIVYPAVPKSLPRLRTIVNLSHTDDDIDHAVTVLERAGRRLGLI
ncbi:MAG TPA: bifunctional SDR family oxidoreductase/pyridoxal phosphate-dependent aminotransferase family protein [Pseudonocardia sp.]|nr:bifunctional SDR family oxidoreductase/pyridoxal phosphate-dependent aminotransferase family protein [Pseudonocardia sp.]